MPAIGQPLGGAGANSQISVHVAKWAHGQEQQSSKVRQVTAVPGNSGIAYCGPTSCCPVIGDTSANPLVDCATTIGTAFSKVLHLCYSEFGQMNPPTPKYKDPALATQMDVCTQGNSKPVTKFGLSLTRWEQRQRAKQSVDTS